MVEYRTLGKFLGEPEMPTLGDILDAAKKNLEFSRRPVQPEELRACYERIAQLESTLGECAAWFDLRADIVDGDCGMPSPNAEMQMMSYIDEIL